MIFYLTPTQTAMFKIRKMRNLFRALKAIILAIIVVWAPDYFYIFRQLLLI